MSDARVADALRKLARLAVHDLRNPLSAVITNLDFARGTLARNRTAPMTAEAQEALADSAVACDALRLVLANLELFARDPEQRFSALKLALEPVCREVVAACSSRAQQLGTRLAFEGAPRELFVRTDRALFALALENLIANAIQHAPNGSVVTIAVVVHDGSASVIVRDHGGAIAPELREHAVGVEGQLRGARSVGTRYGRGAGLHTASAAAACLGIELVLGGEGEQSEIALALPLEPS